jgi:hypothetical protein
MNRISRWITAATDFAERVGNALEWLGTHGAGPLSLDWLVARGAGQLGTGAVPAASRTIA